MNASQYVLLAYAAGLLLLGGYLVLMWFEQASISKINQNQSQLNQSEMR